MQLRQFLKICPCLFGWLVFSSAVFGQTPTPTPIPAPTPIPTPPPLETLKIEDPPFKLVRGDEPVPLHLALVRDEEADDDDKFPWYVNINKGEIIKFDLPECEQTARSNTQETLKCYQLFSSKPSVVAVVDRQFLVGMAKRGDAVITIKEVEIVNTLTDEETGDVEKKEESRKQLGRKEFPLGFGLRDFPSITFRISTNTDKKIIAIPSLKSYRAVRDTYGKAIAKNYLVIAVNIINNNAGKQFLVQNVSISFDPNQCNGLADNWAGVNAPGVTLRKDIDRKAKDAEAEANTFEKRKKCIDQYETYFLFPNTITPTDSNTMLAVNEAERYRSTRYRIFQSLRFAADVGGGLTAFKLLGRDGITGFNFLGGTLFNAADTAVPKISDEKRENLRKDVPQPNLIVKGNDYQTVNIFVPVNHVFSKKAWELYRTNIGKIEKDDDKFQRFMLLFLVANSSGILIDENSKQVESKQGGGAVIKKQ